MTCGNFPVSFGLDVSLALVQRVSREVKFNVCVCVCARPQEKTNKKETTEILGKVRARRMLSGAHGNNRFKRKLK